MSRAAAYAEWIVANADKRGTPEFETVAAAYKAARAEEAPKERGLGERLAGIGEAALTVATGATGGALGLVGGTLGGLAGAVRTGKIGTPEGARMVEEAASQGAQALTYAPRTEAGREALQPVAEVAQSLVPLAGLTPQTAAIATATRQAAPAVQTAAAAGAEATRRGVAKAAEKVAQMRSGPDAQPMAEFGSVGAAGTGLTAQRGALAQSLPEPVKLTKGQATRDQAQLRFEQETAKTEAGARLRERYSEQNQAFLRSFDSWLDETGGRAPDLRAVGVAVDKALVQQAKQDKARYRAAYHAADRAGEMRAPAPTDTVASYLNANVSAEGTTPLLTAVKKEMVRLGGASVDENGNLIPGQLTLQNMEQLRKFVNKANDQQPTNARAAVELKRAIDAATEGVGGDLYKEARALRIRYAQNYENRAIVAKLLDTKRGTTDRAVAFEDVFDTAIMRGSLDDVRNVRRVLQRAGEDGKQAWRELQGATLNQIRTAATSNVGRDQFNRPIVSAAGLDKAIRGLDVDGRLEFIFGKQGAQTLRDMNDLAKVIYTVPPGTVNTSNTAGVVLAGLAEMGVNGSIAGVPLPVATGLRQLAKLRADRKLQKRIDDALKGPQ